ncbi:RNA polymerase sigma factor RpoE [soil metagenome]
MNGSDNSLPARLAKDAHAAFGDVVMTYQDLVYGVCLRIVRDPAAAEDLAQEAFVNAYRALRRYPARRIEELRLRPWLARIALNLARNAVRDRRAGDELDETVEPRAPAGDEPLNLAQRREERNLWARLLAGLPERYSHAVALRHVDGLSYSELAQALGKPAGTVKSDVHRGVALLRAAYDAEQRRVAQLQQKEAV